MQTQYYIQNKRPDLLLSKRKLLTEIGEYHHVDRDPEHKKEKPKLIEDHGYTFIWTNPDAPDFNINRLMNEIYMHIVKSTQKQIKESPKKSLIDDLSKSLLELEFKSNHSIKSNCLKWIVKNILPEYKKRVTKNT